MAGQAKMLRQERLTHKVGKCLTGGSRFEQVDVLCKAVGLLGQRRNKLRITEARTTRTLEGRNDSKWSDRQKKNERC